MKKENSPLSPLNVEVIDFIVMENTSVRYRNYEGMTFSSCRFDTVLFKGCTFKSCVFSACLWEKCQFVDCTFENCTFFFGANRQADFLRCLIAKCNLVSHLQENFRMQGCSSINSPDWSGHDGLEFSSDTIVQFFINENQSTAVSDHLKAA